MIARSRTVNILQLCFFFLLHNSLHHRDALEVQYMGAHTRSIQCLESLESCAAYTNRRLVHLFPGREPSLSRSLSETNANQEAGCHILYVHSSISAKGGGDALQVLSLRWRGGFACTSTEQHKSRTKRATVPVTLKPISAYCVVYR